MNYRYWPMSDIRLTTPDLELRHLTESDLDRLASVSAHRRGNIAGEMTHLRLTREQWLTSGWPEQMDVVGVEPRLALFGLD